MRIPRLSSSLPGQGPGGDTPRRPGRQPQNWRECAEDGMTLTEAARHLGKSASAGSSYAKRHGLKFRDGRRDEANVRAHAERMRQRMRQLHQDPEFARAHAERMRQRMRQLHQDPEFARANAERMRQRMRQRHQDPKFAKANAERMRQLHQDPEFARANAERMRQRMRQRHQDPKFNPLAALTPEQRADYDVLKKAGYSRAEAFAALGIKTEAGK